ncbi:hypothetical protein J7I93_09150 [Bacillus sp. ISL-47]|uniref:hypothetical protein n=1 Tax=Bacillus sp. ISL-47 TaxID=2819130 RepID=UPI001BE53543|nr:hypothetical protein [Bacillus sp. ISL-47]MBT2688347.1 hypothetical protein [Bacillus sp. ISL-47]MBT2710542.1 hypothetical protein [Pseudomonas sp. ISL-84]
MKKLKTSILIIVLSLTLVPVNSFAVSPEKLPVKMSSKQWSLQIGRPDNMNPELNRSKNPNIFNFFSMDLKNIGDKNIKLVRIEAYRDDPDVESDIELFTIENIESITPSFHHHNFPLLNGAKLKVIVTWTIDNKGQNERKFQDRFIFDN